VELRFTFCVKKNHNNHYKKIFPDFEKAGEYNYKTLGGFQENLLDPQLLLIKS
jgi:hypothetical protein